MEEDSLLDALDDDILVKETQKSPTTFTKNMIKRLGICQRIEGTEAVNNTNIQSINILPFNH